MPIYEYRCSECGAHFEKMQKVSDAPLTVCEVCGGQLEKQWSLSGFQFKGEGWYVTDYSSKLKDKGADKTAKTEKTADAENAKPAEAAEKKSAGESTAQPQTASKDASEKNSAAKKETTSTTKN